MPLTVLIYEDSHLIRCLLRRRKWQYSRLLLFDVHVFVIAKSPKIRLPEEGRVTSRSNRGGRADLMHLRWEDGSQGDGPAFSAVDGLWDQGIRRDLQRFEGQSETKRETVERIATSETFPKPNTATSPMEGHCHGRV